MTTPDYQNFQVGNALLPTTTSLTNTSLLDFDPAIYYILDFFSWIIATDVGPRLVAANSAIGGPITAAYAQRYPYAIEAYKLENGFQFPLIAINRTGTEFTKLASSYYSYIGSFDVWYVFPPLTAAQAEQLLPVFAAVEKAITDRTVNGFDPAYTPPGGSLGQQPWSATLANVQEIGIDKSEYGSLQGSGDVTKLFPALHLMCHVTERKNYSTRDTPRPFTGGDITEGLRAPDGTLFGTLVQASTQNAPTFTSVSAATGSHAGGTSVTITGTLFKGPNIQVLFGNVSATSIVVVSATSITCVTPAMSGASAVNVTIINSDGQQVVATNAFTFT